MRGADYSRNIKKEAEIRTCAYKTSPKITGAGQRISTKVMHFYNVSGSDQSNNPETHYKSKHLFAS